jgi:uncharacterized phage-associated protein
MPQNALIILTRFENKNRIKFWISQYGWSAMAHSAIAVANYLLRRAWGVGIGLTPMQLLKLVYIAHGWSLAIGDRPLIRDEIEAWAYGPVIRSLYDSVKHYGRDPIAAPLKTSRVDSGTSKVREEEPVEPFTDDERVILDRVVEVYGPLRAYQLSALTHKEGTPWSKANALGHATISDPEIAEHFRQLAQDQEVERHAR